MEVRSFLAALGLAAAFATAPAAHATIFTVTTEGTADSTSVDGLNLFNTGGQSIAGAHFKLTSTVDTTPEPQAFPNPNYVTGTAPGYQLSLTINGITWTSSVPIGNYVEQYLGSYLSGTGSMSDYVVAHGYGPFMWIAPEFSQYVSSSSHAFVPSPASLTSHILYTPHPGDVAYTYFEAYGPFLEHTYLYSSSVDYIEVNAQEVPEPAILPVIALGLAGIGAIRRRRSTHTG